MATINLSLSAKVDKITGKSQILMQFVGRRECVYRVKSGIYIEPARWKNGRVLIPRSAGAEQRQYAALQAQLDSLCNLIIEQFAVAPREIISKEWLSGVIDTFHNPNSKQDYTTRIDFFSTFDRFILLRRVSAGRSAKFKVLKRMLQRYELWSGVALDLNTMTADTLRSFENYLRDEHQLLVSRPEILEAIPESRKPEQRGRNTISEIMRLVRTFVIWSINEELTANNPFKRYTIATEQYGTPYYITIEERNRIACCNLSRHPQLAIQRDIFVFQCLIGCRVGDLLKLTHSNLVDGAIEYVPRKTMEGRPVTVRVPLNSSAREIVERYKDSGSEGLLPFISSQKYNDAIKRIFIAARLTRLVTIINPTTGKQEQRRLCDIASSHLARRTFVGNLYKQVKDPNLVGALSGHTEGSRAFARYRNIDEDMKKDLVKLLE